MLTRVDISHFMTTYDGRNSFPYTKGQLASALGLIARHKQLLAEDLREMDTEEPEVQFISQTCPSAIRWYN